MKKTILMLLLALSSISVYTQELKVKSMVINPNDLSAKKFERMDLNDELCALLKVKLSSPGAVFEGNVIPPIEYKGGEYWVYMTAGSQELRIKHPDFVPLHIAFADFDIKRGVKSSFTYILTLQMPEENVDDGLRYLQLRVNPINSKVSVDGKLQETDAEGVVSVKLPKGTHKYKIEADGYESKVGLVEIKDKSITEIIALTPTAPIQLYNRQGIPYETFKVGDVSFNMVHVEGGTFMMSDRRNKNYVGKSPVHKVTLSSFYIGETEVTQELWHKVMGGTFRGSKNLPVEKVSWNDCQEFINKLNQLTGLQFRLPTEAEWEYAARGGNMSRGYKYSGSDFFEAVAWHSRNSGGNVHEVGQRAANELGLYDMTGNVDEWCNDFEGEYQKKDQINPTGPAIGRWRIYRGGSYYDGDGDTYKETTTYRASADPSGHYTGAGLRLVLIM